MKISFNFFLQCYSESIISEFKQNILSLLWDVCSLMGNVVGFYLAKQRQDLHPVHRVAACHLPIL